MKTKRIVLLIGLIAILGILGVSYAWFNYRNEGANQKLINGELFLYLEDNTDTFLLQNVYPLSVEEARNRNDNVINFTVSGKNTSSSNIHYEIKLAYGDDDENLVRFNDKDLVFDLIEVDANNSETYLLDAVSFNSINERKIWIDSVLTGQNTEIEKNYKLRVWLSDNVLISDSDPNADYTAHSGTTTDFKNHYASLRVAVYGDLKGKSLPLTIKTNDNYVENGKSYFLGSVTNDYLLEDEGKSLDSQDQVIVTITNPENKLLFSYTDGGDVSSTSESLTLTYNYIVNRKYDVKVFLESKNDANVETDLNFVVRKNGQVVQEFVKRVFVIGNNYCLNNGFTKLSDCILVTEKLSKNVNDAKTYIASKGEPDVNSTAPSYTYEYHVSDTLSTNVSLESNPYIVSTFTFDSTSGKYTLYNVTHTLSETHVGYYVGKECGYFADGIDICNYLYKIVNVHTDTNTIDGYKIESSQLSVIDSQIGLYQVHDFNNQYSYVFRGAVENNNVKFGDMYWKIIRINGDGSIRMIYNGTTLNTDGNKTAGTATGIGRYAFNISYIGPTYVGYMYNEADTPTEGVVRSNSYFTSTSTYYWGDDYTYETDSDGITRFKLKSTNYPLVPKTTTEMKTAKGTNTNGEEVSQLSLTPYTCRSTSSSGTCLYLMKVSSITNGTTARVSYISMQPTSKEESEANNKSSNAKKKIDEWYENTFSTKLNNEKNVTTYLADSIFCNDRRTNDSGYLLNVATNYSAYYRLRMDDIKTATLTCNKNDAFTIEETSISNGALTYPVGLITADEVALAGGKYNILNSKYYLYTGDSYYTMTPSSYNASDVYSLGYYVEVSRGLRPVYVYYNGSLRPVINLSKDVKISGGDGTATNPYILE